MIAEERLTIVRCDTLQMGLPAQVLSVYFAQVGHEEGVFLARLAFVRIDLLDVPLKSRANQFLGHFCTIMSILSTAIVRDRRDRLQIHRGILFFNG